MIPKQILRSKLAYQKPFAPQAKIVRMCSSSRDDPLAILQTKISTVSEEIETMRDEITQLKDLIEEQHYQQQQYQQQQQQQLQTSRPPQELMKAAIQYEGN